MDQPTRRALAVGFATTFVAAFAYLELSQVQTPIAIFAVPPLLTSTIGRWRATLAVGVLGLLFAVVAGLDSSYPGFELTVRLAVTGMLVAISTALAFAREREHRQLLEFAEASSLYHVFEAGLLPSPSAPPGYDVAVRFVSSDQQMTLGGDLVDAVDLPDGRLAIVIGDVCGHGPREAAFATAVRAGWRTIVRTHRPDPSAWLSDLRRTLYAGTSDLPYVTICTGILDQVTGEMTIAVAGHPPPVALDPPVAPLVLRHGPPLGTDELMRWPNQRIAIGSGLVFYTDGLIENPASAGPPNRWGEAGLVERIRDWSVEHGVPANHDEREAFVSALVNAARHGRVIADDLAVMVVAADRRARHPSNRSAATGSRRSRDHELIEIRHPA